MPCFAVFGAPQNSVARIQADPGDLLYEPGHRAEFLERTRSLPALPSDPSRLTVSLLRTLCQSQADIPLPAAFRLDGRHVDMPKATLLAHAERRFHACQKRKALASTLDADSF
eukprot:15091941-Alexandrium_andersonii.AAC.1